MSRSPPRHAGGLLSVTRAAAAFADPGTRAAAAAAAGTAAAVGVAVLLLRALFPSEPHKGRRSQRRLARDLSERETPPPPPAPGAPPSLPSPVAHAMHFRMRA